MNATELPIKDRERILDLDNLVQDEIEEKMPPICKVWGWKIIHEHRLGHEPPWLMADTFEDHPKLGRGTNIRTTKCLWIDVDMKMVRTRNTLYRLMGPGEF